MKKHIWRIWLLLPLCTIWAHSSLSQHPGIRSAGNWETYLLEIKGDPALISLNMELYPQAPAPTLPFIMIVSQDFGDCLEKEFPKREALDHFAESFANLMDVIGQQAEGEWVGGLIYQCTQLEYLYVADTVGLRGKVDAEAKNGASGAQWALELKADPEWGYYREFLYPNEFYRESMANQKVILTLLEAGDELTQPRKVEHWLYFPDKKGMNACMKDLEKEGFVVEKSQKLKEGEMPYELIISRTDLVDLGSMNVITLSLRKKAEKWLGTYDGWETFVVK